MQATWEGRAAAPRVAHWSQHRRFLRHGAPAAPLQRSLPQVQLISSRATCSQEGPERQPAPGRQPADRQGRSPLRQLRAPGQQLPRRQPAPGRRQPAPGRQQPAAARQQSPAPGQAVQPPQEQPAGRPPWMPFEAMKGQSTCSGILALLQSVSVPPEEIPMWFLSMTLSQLVKVSKRPGYRLTAGDGAAVRLILGVAGQQLSQSPSDPWTVTAYIRCATHFKEQLQPAAQLAVLRAWQAAVERVGIGGDPDPDGGGWGAQNVGNTMLAWGTLADSHPALLAAVDQDLAAQLLRHAVGLARADRLPARHAVEALYGAALLGLQPSQEEANALFYATWAAAGGLWSEDLTQLLLGCARLMTVERAAGESPPPSRDPYLIYYPGGNLMARLMDRARGLADESRLTVWAASQILGACGTMGYLPSPAAMEQLLAVLLGGTMGSINAAASIYGCARLGVHPGQHVVQACLSGVLLKGRGSSQALANTMWALAVLEACDPGMWTQLAVLFQECPAPKITELAMVHQAYLLLKARYGEAAVHAAMPPPLLGRTLAVHMAQKPAASRAGRFERLLSEAVQGLAGGLSVEPEYAVGDPAGEGWVWVDVALPGLRVAVEADGPYHFLRNGEPGQQDGTTRARNRLLAAWGWHVIVVPYDTAWAAIFKAEGTASPPDSVLLAGLQRYLLQDTDLMQRLRPEGDSGTAPAA